MKVYQLLQYSLAIVANAGANPAWPLIWLSNNAKVKGRCNFMVAISFASSWYHHGPHCRTNGPQMKKMTHLIFGRPLKALDKSSKANVYVFSFSLSSTASKTVFVCRRKEIIPRLERVNLCYIFFLQGHCDLSTMPPRQSTSTRIGRDDFKILNRFTINRDIG